MSSDNKAQVICLTPVKNEAWILDRFLQCASLWADHIIIADQCSEDGSREIAHKYPKVRLVDNRSVGYDEGERQRLIFEEARRIPGKRIMLAIDADEAVTANWMESAEWKMLQSLKEGTVIYFPWVNLLPDFHSCWIPYNVPMGFVDDNLSSYSAGQFHVPRLPIPDRAPKHIMNEVKVLHYQYSDWNRMKSKQRGYQCYERVDNPSKRPIAIYRQFHHMDAIPAEQIHPVETQWLAGYEHLGIDMKQVLPELCYRWDKEIVDMLLQYGTGMFRKIDIWDVDWHGVAKSMDMEVQPGSLKDPRTFLEKRIHRWLAATQSKAMQPRIRYIQRALRLLGW